MDAKSSVDEDNISIPLSKNKSLNVNFGRRPIHVSSRYSRFVGMMKLLLPTLAVGLVVTIIIWPNEFKNPSGFHLSYADNNSMNSETLAMVKPRYQGTDEEGRPFLITADVAIQYQKDNEIITLKRLQADISMSNGQWVTLIANSGTYNQKLQHLLLHETVNLFSDQGYEFNAQVVKINLNDGRANTNNPIHGQGPFGTLQADSLVAEKNGDRLYFKGNVKLHLPTLVRK